MTPQIINLPLETNECAEPSWSAIFTDPSDQQLASRNWHLTVDALRTAGTLVPINVLQIKRYCIVLVMYEQQAAAIVKEGAVIKNGRTKLASYNPRWSIYKDCDAQASHHEAELGLSPRRRGQVTPVKATKTKTNADQFLKAG